MDYLRPVMLIEKRWLRWFRDGKRVKVLVAFKFACRRERGQQEDTRKIGRRGGAAICSCEWRNVMRETALKGLNWYGCLLPATPSAFQPVVLLLVGLKFCVGGNEL